MGIEAYQAAGGTLQEDLFNDAVRLLDEHLLNCLVEQRMEQAVEFAKLRGWKWVAVLQEAQARYDASRGLTRLEKTPLDLPDADAAEMEELEDRMQREKLPEADLDRLAELQARAEGDYSDDDIPNAGIWLYLDYDGTIERHGPYLDNASANEDEAGESGAAPGQPETKALPQNLIEDLARIRLAALQHRAASQPELLLDLLAWQLSGETAPYSKSLNVTANRHNIAPEKAEGLDLPGSLADQEGQGRERQTAEAFAAFRALGKKHRNEVLARGLARTLEPASDMRALLAATLRPSPREIWTPTATGYFSRLPVPHLDAIWRELVPEDRMDPADFERLKKAEKAKALEKLFNDADYREALALSREQNNGIDAWLPEQLQWPALEGEADG